MRGTGRSTKNIYLALMSDHRHNIVLAPNRGILDHLVRIFKKHSPKFECVIDSRYDFRVGDTYYFFVPLARNVHHKIIAFEDPAVFPDHACFEMPYATEAMMYELGLITEIIKSRRAACNAKVQHNSGQIKDKEKTVL